MKRPTASALLRTMVDEARSTGRALGHAQALHDASLILFRMIDRAKDKGVKQELQRARWQILRLSVGAVEEREKAAPAEPHYGDLPREVSR